MRDGRVAGCEAMGVISISDSYFKSCELLEDDNDNDNADSLFKSTSSLMSNTFPLPPSPSSSSRRYGSSSVPLSSPRARNGSSAAASTTQALMLVPKFFELNGPSGTYSHACTSRADQSFSSTYPKIAERAREAGTTG